MLPAQPDVDQELERLHAAQAFIRAVENGERHLPAHEFTRATVVGALLEADETLGAECEAAGHDYAKARRTLAEIAVWFELLEAIDDSTAQEGWSAADASRNE